MITGRETISLNHPREGQNPRGEKEKDRSDHREGNNQLKPSKGQNLRQEERTEVIAGGKQLA